jgi:UDP-N-acetylmuramate--alanine ligase
MKNYKYVYLIGIGGIGMSAIARWFNAQSVQVFGYDRSSSTLTDQLTQEGIGIHFEDHVAAIPEHITRHRAQSLIVYTPAISSHNGVLKYLSANNYTVRKRAEVLGMITQGYRTLAIAGTHGKTTTTALAAHLLYSAGKSVVGFLGDIAKGYASNLLIRGPITKDTIMVVEADEFDRSFLHLQPHLAIVTTVDPDHLDTYGDEQRFREAFKAFMALVLPAGKVIVHQKAAQQLRIHQHAPGIVCYALKKAAVNAENASIKEREFYFDYVSREVSIKNIRLAVPGYHNIENALAAIAACLTLGLDTEAIRRGMDTFQGVNRRFDYVIRNERIVFIDDFAHHPVEITALLQAIRALYPDKDVTAVFRPHLYTRTRDLASEFARSLDLADQVLLLDIYPAREEPIDGVTSACIFERMTLHRKQMCNEENLLDALSQYGKPDLVVMMGAGGTGDFVSLLKNFLLSQWGEA